MVSFELGDLFLSYAINIADSSGMQDACHIKSVIDLAQFNLIISSYIAH